MQNEKSFEEECKSIIEWQKTWTSPQALFELPEPIYNQGQIYSDILYDKEAIKKAFREKILKFHPDKNPENKDLAAEATQVIYDVYKYLIYTIERNTDIDTKNPFYVHYHREFSLKNRDFEDMIREGYNLNKRGLDLTRVVNQILTDLTKTPKLVRYECDSFDILDFVLSGKSILYVAAEWNQPNLFKYLLERGADPIKKTTFGMSTLDIAISRRHTEILAILANSSCFGRARLKTEMEKLFCNNLSDNSDSLLRYYLELFENDLNIQNFMTNFPLMIPVLCRLGRISVQKAITLYRQVIIGRPEFYHILNQEERADKFILIATLAQNCSDSIAINIPRDKLEPGFIAALCEFWPNLTHHLNTDTSNTPLSFDVIKTVLFCTIFCIMMLVLAYHFWPIIALWPEALLQTIVANVVVPLFTLGIVGFVFSAINGYRYATEVYPETRAIQKILVDNKFFKSSTPLEPNPDPDENLAARYPNSGPRGT